MKKIWHWAWSTSIRRQLILGVALVHMVLMTIFVFDLVHRQKSFLNDRARSRTIFQAESLARTSIHAVLSNDVAGLDEIMNLLRTDSTVRSALVTNERGIVLGDSDRAQVGKRLADPQSLDVIKAARPPGILFEQSEIMEAYAPLQVAGRTVGWAFVSNDLSQDRAHLAYVTHAGLIYTLLAILLGTLFAIGLSRAITKSLHSLVIGTERLAADDFKHPVPVTTDNEIGILTRAFNDAAARLNRQREELKESKVTAERANEAKSNFLANMSHEIRTPLGAVLGFSELMLSADSNDDRRGFNEVIKRNGGQLLRLIDDLLDISKIEAGHIQIEKINFRTNDLLGDTISYARHLAGEKSVGFKVIYETAVPDTVYSDPVRVRQCVVNLVNNAVKFTPAGGTVEIKIKFLPHPDSRMEIQIKDSGIGISESARESLFKPFCQGDVSSTRKYGGTGLGLALSLRLAQALGGDLTLLNSSPGKGSEFSLRIPLTEVLVEDFPRSLKSELKIPTESRLKGLRVLVVDDSQDNLDLITRFVEGAGASSERASDGAEGVHKALHGKFDIVLMDIQMPGMDGFEAIRRLRGLGYQVPIIALTAHALPEDRIRCLRMGFSDHLTKPLNRLKLVNAVDQFAHAEA